MNRTRPAVAALVVCLAVAVGGCGGGEGTSSTGRDAESKATVAGSAKIPSSDPGLVATDQPGATVLEQWRDLQEGAAPAVLLTYTPDVIAATKSENLVGAAAAVGVNLAPYTPVVVDQRTAKDARILTVDGYAPGAATIHYTYIMKRVDGKWLIWYDTLMESALQGYAALAETAGDTGTPSAAILTNDFRTPSAQAFGSSVATKRATESPK